MASVDATGGDEMTEKEEIEVYLEHHDLERQLNEVVNRLVKEKPLAEDPFMKLSRLLKEKSGGRGIQSLKARSVIGGGGVMTLEVEVVTDQGVFTASAAGGRSNTGLAYLASGVRGMSSVRSCVSDINKIIAPRLLGLDPCDQKSVDATLSEPLSSDPDARTLPPNAILAVSIAVARAGAKSKEKHLFEHIADLYGVPPTAELRLPVPCMSVLDEAGFGSFCVMPVGASSVREAVDVGVAVYLAAVGMGEPYTPYVESTDEAGSETKDGDDAGDEEGKAEDGVSEAEHGDDAGVKPPAILPPRSANGGWKLPGLDSAEAGLSSLVDAISRGGADDLAKIAIDVAAPSILVKPGDEASGDAGMSYRVAPTSAVTSEGLTDVFRNMIETQGVVMLNDPFDGLDVESWKRLTEEVGRDVAVCGGDLVCSNRERLGDMVEIKACNCVTVTPGAIGSLSDVFAVTQEAESNALGVVVCSDDADTEDSFLADLAVGMQVGVLRAGAPSWGQSISKYNRLSRIEDLLGEKAQGAYVGPLFNKL